MPSLCSLLHHYPLLPVLQNPMQAEGEVTTLNAGGYSYRGKGGRRQNRNASATITTMTVTVPQETNKVRWRAVENLLVLSTPIKGNNRARVKK